MATYVIGDVQGCFESLRSLLTKIQFDSAVDRLLFTGDLVNRGPNNLQVLQFIKGLGKSADAVLGNHDLHLISRHFGFGKTKKSDTLNDVLQSKQANELINWLMQRPFVLNVENFLLVHAGFGADWSLKKIESAALKMSERLNDKTMRAEIFANEKFPEEMSIMTTIRMCDRNGEKIKYSGSPELAPPGYIPWFVVRNPELNEGKTILFGHWAGMGARKFKQYVCLDSGCVWGGKLTAMRLSDQKFFSVPSVEI